jgi:hypothetical protein
MSTSTSGGLREQIVADPARNEEHEADGWEKIDKSEAIDDSENEGLKRKALERSESSYFKDVEVTKKQKETPSVCYLCDRSRSHC